MSARLVLVTVAPGLPADTLRWPAWQALRGASAVVAPATLAAPLRAAGLDVEELPQDPAEWVRGPLAVGPGDPPLVCVLPVAALSTVLDALPGDVDPQVVTGSQAPPGAGLLDVVATMDRLRSPGGCPWDAAQTHASLARYLLEEAYEAYEALETGDLLALREELGDVLLQVVFHARLAEELPEGERFDVDDVAGDLVAKLVRRHPHVFAGATASDPEAVSLSWEQLKAAEKGRASVTDGVPMGQPALALAATLQRKAARVGVPAELVLPSLAAAESTAAAVAAEAAALLDEPVPPSVERVGALLFAVVALAREAGVDPEAALRGAARRFRDRLAAVERDTRAAGQEPAVLAPEGWRSRWVAEQTPSV